MQIATWNVNSLSVRLPQVLAWLAANPVDALCLQELKLTDDKFPHLELEAAGYQCVSHGQKTYNGVAILSRQPLRDVVRNIPGFADEQSRKESHQHERALTAVFFCAQQENACEDPDDAGVAEHRELWDHGVEKRAGDVVLDPVENAPVERHGRAAPF